MILTPEQIETFWSRHYISEKGCWIWTGVRNGKQSHQGYGLYSFNKQSILAHRLSWMLTKGEIPSGIKVCHTCDVRRCINPKHLFLGSQKDNIQDAVKKGRWKQQGEHNPQSKLNWAKVEEIRVLYKQGIKQSEIAKNFNISPKTVSSVVTNTTWKIS